MTEDDKILVACSGCEETDYSTREELVAAGWLIEDDTQLCPLDNCG